MIPDEEMPKFKATLKACMKMRNFNLLRKDILPVIKQIRETSARKFDETMFSKKFWSTFLNKEENKDIKDIWVSLPQTKVKSAVSQNRVKNVIVKEALSPNTCESENEKSPSSDDALFDKLSFALKQEQKTSIWEDETHSLHDYINTFDENEPQYSVERFMADTEDILSENTPDRKPMETEDNHNFLGEFWSEWNQRQMIQDNKFTPTVLQKGLHLPTADFELQKFITKEGSFNNYCTNDLEFFKEPADNNKF